MKIERDINEALSGSCMLAIAIAFLIIVVLAIIASIGWEIAKVVVVWHFIVKHW